MITAALALSQSGERSWLAATKETAEREFVVDDPHSVDILGGRSKAGPRHERTSDDDHDVLLPCGVIRSATFRISARTSFPVRLEAGYNEPSMATLIRLSRHLWITLRLQVSGDSVELVSL